MSKRELRSLAELNLTTSCLHHRLRSGIPRDPHLGMEGAEETSDAQVSDVQELWEKLQMAQEELECVRADMTGRLEQAQQTAAKERAGLAEQLRQAQRMAEAANEESARQKCRAQEVEIRLDERDRENEDLRRQLRDAEAGTETEVDVVRLRLELEGLRQLEEVRRQFDERYTKFDEERDRYRREHDRDLALIADLRGRLESSEHPTDTTGESHEYYDRVAPLRSASGEGVEGEGEHDVRGRRVVTFEGGEHTDSPGVIPPTSQESLIRETTNGTSCDSGTSVPSEDTPNPISVASSDLVGVGHSSVSSGELIQQLTQLVQTQTAMVAAQTRAMSAQSLPPIPTYSGEGEQALEDGFERWIEQFEERARLAEWSEDLRRYYLKMRLSKTAFQTYRLLPDEVKANYSATVSALRSKFKPVDIEELRGVEFHQLVQKNQSVEQLGLQLQKVAKRDFPTLVGKDLDRLMKGRFFQALLPKWQRKLGAPKTEESFDELFNRARTMEFREQQYNEIADERRGKDKPRKVDGETTRGKGSDSRSNTSCEGSDSSGPKPTSDRPANRLGLQHIKCRACGQYGHFARNCGQKRKTRC